MIRNEQKKNKRESHLSKNNEHPEAGGQADAGAFFAEMDKTNVQGTVSADQEGAQPITVRELLQDIYSLEASEEQKNDRRYLLAEILGTEKARLILCSQQVLSVNELEAFRKGSRQIADAVPVHYVINKKNFMGLDFFVDKRVLIPRFDTEILVEKVMDDVLAMAKKPLGNETSLLSDDTIHDDRDFDILELCTGSGAIAVSLAALLPAELEKAGFPGSSGMSSHDGGADAKCTDTIDPAKNTFPATDISLSGCPAIHILATDLSPDALEVAKINANRLLSVDSLQNRLASQPEFSGWVCPGNQPGVTMGTSQPRQTMPEKQNPEQSLESGIQTEPEHNPTVELFDASISSLEAAPGAACAGKPRQALQTGNAQPGVQLDFARGDLFRAVPDGRRFDLIIANPPYISPQEYPDLDDQVKQEPYMALVADNDGLAIYEEILQQAAAYLNPGGKIYLEIGSGQAESLRRLGQTYGWSGYQCLKDHAGHDRVIILSA